MGKRIQKVSLNNLESRVLNLGYVGEHEHTRIEIDCTDVLWDYPNAECSMVVQPPTGDMYPLTPVREENSIIWLVTDSDVVYNGTGRVQITFTNDGEIVKSAIANTRIDQSIMATGPVPTPLENWMERAEDTARQMAQEAADATVEDLAEEKEAAIAEIQQAAEDARETIPAEYTQLSDDVSELKEQIVTKAEEDGYYEELTAGSAEQLVSTEAVTDTTPYLYRKSGGSVDVGNRETLEKIVGGTVAWNQLNNNSYSTTTEVGITATKNADGSWTIDGTATGNKDITFGTLQRVNGHKYMIFGCPSNGGSTKYYIGIGGGAVVDIGNGGIYSAPNSNVGYFRLDFRTGVTFSNVKIYPQIFDITQMFGPTIADYIYNLETATPGAGVAWFRKLFPKDYYSYNPGELISVKPSSHDMVGFNLWDEEWELGGLAWLTGEPLSANDRIRSKHFCKCLPNTEYYIKTPSNQTSIFWYDANRNFVSYVTQNNAIVTSPSNAYNFKILVHGSTTYNHDICINLSNSGSRNGEYEPYEKHSYPLADVELRGPLAIDADGKLVYSGDEYTPSGQVKRKYKLVNLGTQNWTYSSEYLRFQTYLPNIKLVPTDQTVPQIMAVGIRPVSIEVFDNDTTLTKVIRGNRSNDAVFVRDLAYTDAAAFKAAMDGVYLLYELATPEIEQVAPYTPVQVVDDWGTEEFVDTREVAIPVGHSTSYMANLRDKLQHLPSLADEDGEYIVKQTGAKMELAKLSSSGLAQSIYVETESAPVVSFADGADGQAMKAVNVAIEPVQDLHGYDSPWPGGGGKNIMHPAKVITPSEGLTATNNNGKITINGSATQGSQVYITFDSMTIPEGYIVALMNSFVNATVYFLKDAQQVDYFSLSTANRIINAASMTTLYGKEFDKIRILFGGNVTLSNANFSVMVVPDGADTTTWSPYSNICPISGFDSVKATRCGKNLFDQSAAQRLVDCFEAVGTPTRRKGFIIKIPDGNYVFSAERKAGHTESAYLYLNKVNSDGTFVAFSYFVGGSTQHADYPVSIENGQYLVFYDAQAYTESSTTKFEHFDLWLTKGSTATAYEQYQGQTYEVTFPTEAGTVYGGTLDVVSGKLVVDRASVTYDGDESFDDYGLGSDHYCAVALISNKKTGYQTSICDSFQNIDGAFGRTDYGIYSDHQTLNQIYFRMPNPNVTTKAEFLEWLSENPMHLVYELATPVTYQLTPQEIKTLLGVNNIWSDAGNTAVTYPADTKLYIDNKIAELQALILENNG